MTAMLTFKADFLWVCPEGQTESVKAGTVSVAGQRHPTTLSGCYLDCN